MLLKGKWRSGWITTNEWTGKIAWQKWEVRTKMKTMKAYEEDEIDQAIIACGRSAISQWDCGGLCLCESLWSVYYVVPTVATCQGNVRVANRTHRKEILTGEEKRLLMLKEESWQKQPQQTTFLVYLLFDLLIIIITLLCSPKLFIKLFLQIVLSNWVAVLIFHL